MLDTGYILINTAIAVSFTIVFFFAEWLIGKIAPPQMLSGIIDRVHNSWFFRSYNNFITLNQNNWKGKIIFVIGSFAIYFAVLFVFIEGVLLGLNLEIISMMVALTARQLIQFTTSLPYPNDLIWKAPGPTWLFPGYGVTNDFYPSGHTIFSTLCSIRFVRSQLIPYPVAACMAVSLPLYIEPFVLGTRAHYFIDVVGGFTLAIASRYFVLMMVPPECNLCSATF